MAIVVEDGTGKTNSDSYESVANADTYLTDYGNPSGWTAASTAAKETALRMATQWIDARFAIKWQGQRTNETQALAWPRAGVYDEDEFLIDDDTMPTRLKRATVELARRYVDDSTILMPDVATSRTERSKTTTIGELSKSVEYAGGVAHEKRFAKVEELLRPFVTTGGFLVRG